MNITVVETTGPRGSVEYMLEHGYDTDIFTGLPSCGPYPSRAEAEAACERLSEALACVND